MRQANITVYGSRTCPDTTRATEHLDRREVAYEFRDLDEQPELNGYVAEMNDGKRVMPTIRIDNQVLINPSNAELDALIDEIDPDA